MHLPFLKAFLLSMMLVAFQTSYGQLSPFLIEGRITGIENGLITTWQPRSGSSFYAFQKQVEIQDGQFQFKGHLEFPQKTNFAVFDQDGTFLFDTGWFYIEPGTQQLQIKKTNNEQQLSSSSAYFKEYVQHYQPDSDSLDLIRRELNRNIANAEFQALDQAIIDSLYQLKNKIKIKEGIFLLEYVLAHPQSFISLQEIENYIDLEDYAFSEKAFSLLDPKLQQTSSGQAIEQKINHAKALETGQRFPDFTLLDLQRNPTTLHREISGSYTLIDFWFNSCGFCIQQFPDLKATYQEFQAKGFTVLGITVDKERFEADWKQVIKEQELPWPQYWDFDGIQCATYLINNFPSNFLLNERYEIIGRNLTVSELRDFLRTKL